MARILLARAVGGPDQLDLVDHETPRPGPGEVVVAVRAAGVNPSDLKQLAGLFGAAEPPFRLGAECAGVVVALGPDTDAGATGPLAVGDDVVAFRAKGAFADEVVVPAGSVFPKPRPLSFEEAAGLLLTGTTAAHLVAATSVGPGDRVLVHGASGSAGAATVQLARRRGAAVVGTCSPRNDELVRGLGATPVAYGAGLADRVRAIWPEGPSVALDCVGTDEALDVSLELVADRDRIATIANFDGGGAAGIRLLGGGPGADPGSALRAAARAELVALADAGEFVVPVGPVVPLADAARAFELVARGTGGGKVVLVP